MLNETLRVRLYFCIRIKIQSAMKPFIQFSSRNIQKSTEYYLAFNIDEECFAANFPKIVGFSKEFSFEPYTGNVSFISGQATINNEQMPVINLKQKLGIPKNGVKNNGKLVIIETEVFGSLLRFGVFYDILGDAFEIPEKKMMPVNTNLFNYENVKGIHLHEGKSIVIVNIENIFSIDDLIDIKVAFTKKSKEVVFS